MDRLSAWDASTMLVCAVVGSAGACVPAGAGGAVWASRVVYGVSAGGEAVYEPGVGTPVTHGPFHADGLWSDPEALVGPVNTLDYDDLAGWGPVPGGFAGGPMRRLSLVWSAWQYGSAELDDLGTRPGWLDGRRRNGLGLRAGGQAVVEFDEPIENNPAGDAAPWGVDFIVHGNAAFAADRAIEPGTSLNSVVLSGGVIGEAVEVSVAQRADGPWYTFERTADGLFPTHPWAWDDAAEAWTGAAQDWGRPVDPSLTSGDFAGRTAAEAAALYAGSAGGTAFDLDEVRDANGQPASLPWARFVRFRDVAGKQGEVCGVVDVPAPGDGGCNVADLAEPRGVLDLSDVTAFVGAFAAGDGLADVAEPVGVLDLADVSAFVGAFSGGCP